MEFPDTCNKMPGAIRVAGECMQVILDLCLVPLGVGVSVSQYVAECHRVLLETGLKHQLHAYGTNIEGITTTFSYM
ncbi:MAG: MTH1187 family thiamine-binding protein [Desulfobulbus sp.]|nr:MTH1187 family thiamine-binding protein [Desulfobulbus sp.]